MVTLTIDGVEVTVERGATILEAAQKAGVRIPTLCHDKRLIPYGACRLCMVEVTARGRTRTMPACFNPARDGHGGSDARAQAHRKSGECNSSCCSVRIRCSARAATRQVIVSSRISSMNIEWTSCRFPERSRYFHVDNESHFIRFNMNLCIKCGMCVRICDEIQGENELSFINRGMIRGFHRLRTPVELRILWSVRFHLPCGAISIQVARGHRQRIRNEET